MVTYQDYLRYISQFSGESGAAQPAFTEDEWENLSLDKKFDNVGQLLIIGPDDERYDELKEKVGGEPGRNITIGGGTGGFDEERLSGAWYNDPSKVFRGDGYIAFSEDNRSAYNQSHDNMTDAEVARAVAIFFALAGGAALLNGGFTTAAGGDALATAPGQGFGTSAGTASNLGGGVSAGTTGAAGATTATIPENLPVETGPPQGGTTLDPIPEVTPGGAPSGSPTGAPAGAPTGAPAGAPTGTPPAGTPPAGNGFINGVRNTWNGVSGWYNGLTPASRFILGTAISQGANAALSSRAQRNAQEAADEQEEEERNDRIRRGQVPAFGNAFTRKPPGILGSRRGG